MGLLFPFSNDVSAYLFINTVIFEGKYIVYPIIFWEFFKYLSANNFLSEHTCRQLCSLSEGGCSHGSGGGEARN